MQATLLAGVALNLVTAGLLAYAGRLVSRRETSRESARALGMFATWWYAVAAVVLLAGAPTLVGLAGVRDVAVFEALSYATALPLAVALWSLLYYLIYLWTGRASALVPLTVAYALFFAFSLVYFSSFEGRTLQETPYSFRLDGGTTPPRWMDVAFGLSVAGPILYVVASYALLYFRVKDPGPRRRIALVSTGFAVWFGAVLLAFLLGFERAEWFPLVYEAPGVLAGLLVVRAYR